MIGSIPTINDLGIGSVQRILSYLRFVDKLKVLLVTKCIAQLAQEIFDSEPFDILHLQVHFSFEELTQLLTDYGSYVKRLRYTEWFNDETTLAYARLLPQNCSNLQEIHFSDLDITMTNIYGQILSSSAQKTIETLTLENCTVTDPACALVANLSKLKVLNLPRSKLSGNDFGRLKNLTELNLRECNFFLEKHFRDILNSNKLVKLNHRKFFTSTEDMLLKTQPNLKVLKISEPRPQICGMKTLREVSIDLYYSERCGECLKELANNRVPIESLELKNFFYSSKRPDKIKSVIVDRIIQLDNLRALSFRNFKFMENSELVKIAKFCRNIEMLDLYGTSVSDEGIIESLKYLKELRHLDVSYCNVEESLYSRLVDIRRELGFVQKLVVYIWLQMELEAILKFDWYADTKAFVQLRLSPMRTERDSSMLERLDQLNLSYCNDNLNLIRKAAKSTTPLSSQAPSLLALDDNSLYHIMEYLPLVDQLRLTLSNSRFESIVKYFLYTNLFNFEEFIKSFAIQEARNLLSRCGHMVKKLDIGCANFRFDAEYYDLLVKYVTNVVELHSGNANFRQKVVSNSQNSLEAIHIINSDIDDEDVMEISKAAKLHTLSFERSHLPEGMHFGSLSNLTSVNLSYVANLEPASFIALCKSNQLKDLNIIGCRKLDDQSFQVLVETQTNLEILAIGRIYVATNIYLVTQLNNLKDLKLNELPGRELMQCTDALAELKCDRLEFLDIYYAYELDATHGLRIAENIATFRNLKYLKIENNSWINHDFIRTIAKGCILLKTLALVDCCDLEKGVVLEAIRLFEHLRHFSIDHATQICIGGNLFLNLLYHEALEIMKRANRGPLVLYGFSRCIFILEMENIREYTINKKYVQLSSKCFEELNKNELVKEETSQSENNVEPRQPNRKEFASSKPSIIEIPGSCLQRIASYLQPVDTLVFACLHKTICVSIVTVLDSLLHNLNDIARIFTLSEARDLFAVCAGHINRIQISMISSTFFTPYINLLQPYCSYLIEIDITWREDYEDNEDYEEVITLFGAENLKLQKLTVKGNFFVYPIFKYLASTPSVGSLYSLNMSDSDFNGQYIDAFKHLTDLNLMNSRDIGNEYFQSICRNCKLKRLNIIGARLLSESSYNVLVNTQNDHLEQLSMSSPYDARNYTEVAKLKNLKHITIEINLEQSNLKPFLKMLVRYHRHDMEFIEIKTYLPNSFEIETYDMVEEVRCYFRNLKNITITDDEKREVYCWAKNNEKY